MGWRGGEWTVGSSNGSNESSKTTAYTLMFVVKITHSQ